MKIIKIRKLKRNTFYHYGVEYGLYLGRNRVASAWKFGGETHISFLAHHFDNLLDTMNCKDYFYCQAHCAIGADQDFFTIDFMP